MCKIAYEDNEWARKCEGSCPFFLQEVPDQVRNVIKELAEADETDAE